MHTSTVPTTRALFECFDCGSRIREPETRDCDRCGSALRNLNQPRDL